MNLLHADADAGYALMRLSFLEWLTIKEPSLFSLADDQAENTLLSLKHADSLSAYSLLVAVVKVDDTLYKLTGKQRKKDWLSGKTPPPEYLIAQVIDLSTHDFLALNTEAQNRSIESPPSNEAVKLIYDELGLTLSSDRLKEGFILEALNIALRGRPRSMQDKRFIWEKEEINAQKAIQVFSEELRLIDNLKPKPEIFVSGVLGGALLMLGINKDVKNFLCRLNDGQGETRDGLEDPISGLLRAIEVHRISDPAIPARMAAELCRKTIQAILLWQDGPDSAKYWRKKILSGVEPRPFIRELKSLKQINEQKDL
ncbi:hypothetical protein A1359_18000 [Methylomonas lenta]|uniref:Uncharacterized protein n=1 Tax=Methylomonas lenta TaxID=980561 RepID=A0A177MVY1_9GAMM|nr:hypothetical protein [Methylomonas lenta]OAI09876.1 hypothetical protein A1359_18000 [Methylomonas lenta]